MPADLTVLVDAQTFKRQSARHEQGTFDKVQTTHCVPQKLKEGRLSFKFKLAIQGTMIARAITYPCCHIVEAKCSAGKVSLPRIHSHANHIHDDGHNGCLSPSGKEDTSSRFQLPI